MSKTSAIITRGRTELAVRAKDSEATFVFPSTGPGTYQSVGAALLKQGLQVPTGEATALLVYEAYRGANKGEPECTHVRDSVKSRWLWVYNKGCWISQGVYIVPDTAAEGRSKPLDITSLEARLDGGTELSNGVRFSKDRTVRFAPKSSYTLGDHTPESLAKDGFMIASYGVEGAQLLADVAATFKNTPYLHGLDIKEGQSPELRVSTLGEGGGRLHVDGGSFGGDGGGGAFGVVAPREARTQKISK